MSDVDVQEHAPEIETPRERTRRHTRRAGLYVHAFALAALLVVLVALLLANNRRVTVSWVIGEDEQSLVWIVLVTAVLGWLLGLVTSMLFRRRTRAPRP